MSRRRNLPLTLHLPMSIRALVYPAPEGGRGVTVRGSGEWTLIFEPTRDDNRARVRIGHICIRLPGTRIPFDIDHDGVLECLEIDGLTLTSEDFDLTKSGGEYDLQTGYLTLKIFAAMRPNFLSPSIEPQTIPFEIRERGWLDLSTGQYKTDAGTWTLRDGPLAGLTIVGDQSGTVGNGECYATMTLGVGIQTPALYGMSAKDASKSVWICPRTPIVLLWEATKCGNVEINPLIGTRNIKDSQTIPSVSPALKAIEQPIRFTADTRGGDCVSAHDEASIYVVAEGDEIAQTAVYQPEYKFWTAQLPEHTYDKNIRVTDVIIDSGQPDSITHPRWRLDHIFSGTPTGTEIPALNNWTKNSSAHALPGEYRFTPRVAAGTTLPAGEQARILYFRLRVTCKA